MFSGDRSDGNFFHVALRNPDILDICQLSPRHGPAVTILYIIYQWANQIKIVAPEKERRENCKGPKIVWPIFSASSNAVRVAAAAAVSNFYLFFPVQEGRKQS